MPIRAGLRISVVSLVWTLAVGAGSLVVGVTSRSLAVAAFGAVGLLDAVGSASLVVQFIHARRRGAQSHRFDRITLRVVTVGLGVTAIATGTLAIMRLLSHGSEHSSRVGIAVSAASIAVLAVLAAAKRRIAHRIPSHALHADSWVSAVGAALAAVATVGVVLRTTAGWWWADPVAALVLSVSAMGLSGWLLTRRAD